MADKKTMDHQTSTEYSTIDARIKSEFYITFGYAKIFVVDSDDDNDCIGIVSDLPTHTHTHTQF